MLIPLQAGLRGEERTILLRGGEIHTFETGIIQTGEILIGNGKIIDLGKNIRIPAGTEVISAEGYLLLPGFFAPYSFLSSEEIKNYESFSPDLSALDRFDFYGDFSRYLAGGVTSAYLGTARDRLISGIGAVVKTACGKRESPILKAEAGVNLNFTRDALLPLRIAIFPAPISPENPLTPAVKQFPSSALGAFWSVNELFRFPSYSGDLALYMENISTALMKIKEMNLPLIVRCDEAAAICRAIDLANFLNLRLIVLGGKEAHKLVDILKKNQASVILESRLRPNSAFPKDEEVRPLSDTITPLIKSGLLVAISPEDEDCLPDLLWIAHYHQRFGIPEEELFKTITLNPARMFGVEDRIGSLAKGKDADILFFRKEDGKPLLRLIKVMSQGQIIHEEK